MNSLFIFCSSGLFVECFVHKVRSGLDSIAQCFKIKIKIHTKLSSQKVRKIEFKEVQLSLFVHMLLSNHIGKS